MNEQRNLILAVVLSAIVLFGWSLVSEHYFPPSSKVVDGKQVPVKDKSAPVANTPAAIKDRRVVLAESPRVAIKTPRLAGSINLKGARIDDLVLTQHRETLDKKSPPVRLVKMRDCSAAPRSRTESCDRPRSASVSPAAMRSWDWTRSTSVTSSVTVCSTWIRGFISMKTCCPARSPTVSTRNSTVPALT